MAVAATLICIACLRRFQALHWLPKPTTVQVQQLAVVLAAAVVDPFEMIARYAIAAAVGARGGGTGPKVSYATSPSSRCSRCPRPRCHRHPGCEHGSSAGSADPSESSCSLRAASPPSARIASRSALPAVRIRELDPSADSAMHDTVPFGRRPFGGAAASPSGQLPNPGRRPPPHALALQHGLVLARTLPPSCRAWPRTRRGCRSYTLRTGVQSMPVPKRHADACSARLNGFLTVSLSPNAAI